MVSLDEILAAAAVIPVIEVADVAAAAPLAEALARGGLRVAELTLRTEAALDAIAAMKKAVPTLIVGMGTILSPQDAERAAARGADFLVSPGLSPALRDALKGKGAPPLLPGVATASETMAALEAGFTRLKFFPAEPAGGVAYLKSLYGPLPAARFCPTGGIGAEMVPAYLATPNVLCVGGSWVASRALVDAKDFAGIEANARTAAAFRKARHG